jgi:hypothetical protein
MDYLYKKPKKVQSSLDSLRQNEIVMPATINIPVEPVKDSNEIKEPEIKQLGHITFISQEEYLRDIETMCKRDKWFMETIKGFCNKVVEVNVEQPIQSDKSTSVTGEGSE